MQSASHLKTERRKERVLTALARNLDQDREVLGGLAVPRLEGLEELQPVALGVDGNVDGSPVRRGRLEGILTRVVATRGKLVTSGVGELEGLAIGSSKGVGEGVEGEVASEGHGGDNIGGGDKGMRGGVSVVTSGEVTVVGGDDWRATYVSSCCNMGCEEESLLELATPF